MIVRAVEELCRRALPQGGAPRALVLAMLLIALAQAPATLLADVRGARSNLRLSPAAAADARGPSASAGTNLGLVHAAQRRIPGHEPFAIVRAGRWGSAASPNRSVAFVWQAGQSWTQFALAPHLQVAPRDAAWLLIRDESPAAAGVRDPVGAWRFGADWLVEVRR
ncbi:MAG: hypothetical protein QOH00_1394 [Gaiellales bacterium]|jgi:hypothetical protein|nr:hypothetical protein [Gaiellales bacterium]